MLLCSYCVVCSPRNSAWSAEFTTALHCVRHPGKRPPHSLASPIYQFPEGSRLAKSFFRRSRVQSPPGCSHMLATGCLVRESQHVTTIGPSHDTLKCSLAGLKLGPQQLKLKYREGLRPLMSLVSSQGIRQQ